jgi:hypothetical protein
LVLSDWDLAAATPRAEALRLRLDHAHPDGPVLVQRIALTGNSPQH